MLGRSRQKFRAQIVGRTEQGMASAAATIDFKALRKAVAAAIRGMKPGEPAPKARATADQLKHLHSLLWPSVRREYEANELRTVARHFDARKTTPEGGCLKAADGPFTKVASGAYGTTWRTKDCTRIFKLSRVDLIDDPGHPVTEMFDAARREFEVGKLAGDLGVGPAVHDAYFCCSTAEACYYVIVMDAVPGVTLRQWLKTAAPAARERMRAKLLTAVARLNAASVEHSDLHSKNVIHQLSRKTGQSAYG